MTTGRLTLLATLAALAAPGCSGSGPLTSRHTMVGSLKASVSQLEFANEKLRKEVGELKADNSRLDSQLAQEREANGEIAARLDDAKDLLRRQGGDTQAMGIRSRTFKEGLDDEIPPPASRPPVRRSKGGRTPPAARIRNPEAEPEVDRGAERGFDSASADLGPTDRAEDDRWLPVARGMGTPVRR